MTYNQIKNEVGDIVKKNFGFTFEDLNNLTRCIYNIQKTIDICYIDKTVISDKINTDFKMKRETLDSIIDFFSIELNINANEKIDLIRVLELKSILQLEGSVLIHLLDLIYNINCFEKFLMRKHFVEYLTYNWNSNARTQLDKSLSKLEEKVSSFLAYVLLDVFITSGYRVPMNKNIPLAEIKSITKIDDDKRTINILNIDNSSGDIDVLAISESKKEIYNVEIKYYKPLDNIQSIYSSTKEAERKKNVKTPLNRGEILYYNRSTVLKYMDLDVSESAVYKVRTILVTPRPDYWMQQDNRGVEYYEWVEFIDALKKNLL